MKEILPQRSTIALVNGILYTPTGVIENGTLLLHKGSIVAVGAREETDVPSGAVAVDAAGCHITPGFVDLHVHGLLGNDVMGSGLSHVIRALPAYGVTGFLATTVTLPEDETAAGLSAIAAALSDPPVGAHCLGIHLEGPFLAPSRAGMAASRWLEPVTWARVRRLVRAAEGHIRMVTLAPELPGAMPCIRRLTEMGIVASVGHSDASFEQVARAVRVGLRHATHTFNAMRPLHHRAPGVVGAVMYFEEIVAQVVADGVHVHPAVVEMLVRVKGLERVALVSDASPMAGLPDGEYEWAGQTIRVRSGACRLHDGTIAGSHALLDAGVRTLVQDLGLPLRQVVIPAAAVPATVLGSRAGRLAPGYDADIVLLDESLHPVRTYVGGIEVFRRAGA
jgi:N-acetylglucosamine-6-phosphate deacetylase